MPNKNLRKNLGIPDDWDSQDIKIYKDMLQSDERELLHALLKYLEMQKNPGDVPRDFIEKHIKVADYILRNKKGLSQLDKIIDYCQKHNHIP